MLPEGAEKKRDESEELLELELVLLCCGGTRGSGDTMETLGVTRCFPVQRGSEAGAGEDAIRRDWGPDA